jgi:hypothetical protein
MSIIVTGDENTDPIYVTRWAVTAVHCSKCNVLVIPPAPPQVPIKDLLHAMAKALHGATGVVCGDPCLVISHCEVLVDNRRLEQPAVVGNSSVH